MSKQDHEQHRQILGRVRRDEFVGRSAELERLLAHAASTGKTSGLEEARGLLILLSPVAGVSELLRQTFDRLFHERANVAPIFFTLPQDNATAVSSAIEFLNTFLAQYVAFRRDEPALCQALLTLDELVRLAPPADLDWITELVDAYNRLRFGDDDRELVRLCGVAPARVPPSFPRPFVMLDAVHLADADSSSVPLAFEFIRALRSSGDPFVLAGQRREIVYAVERANGSLESFETLHLEQLPEADARKLVTAVAQRQHVAINDETRDLLVQQLEGSPFFITSFLQAAREHHIDLNSYLDCERLYVDELMGGRLYRFFTAKLEQIAPEPETRALVVRLLCEAQDRNVTVSADSWRRRLKLESVEFDRVLRQLHHAELINWNSETIDPTGNSAVWKDFLRTRFRLDWLREPRALVVADLMADALKRAPQTVARHYRKAASLRLRELLGRFNYQLVPKVLFDYAEFAGLYKGGVPEEIAKALDADTNLIRLPQVFHAASGNSFGGALREYSEESAAVAHAFSGGAYTNDNEIVWLVGKLESKLEASETLVNEWLKLLDGLSRQSGFVHVQIWLIANEGFSEPAMRLLRERGAFRSSRQQFELLTARLSDAASQVQQTTTDGEFALVVPMDAENELLAATTVEQVARRLNFSPEAINQIKTAVVEACINAAEHSLSPDRKIYQRFRVEDDKLVVTISSRGILPANIADKIQADNLAESGETSVDDRRGWGLKLIKTLMDEVEFERVDEGTSLRMTKYLRRSSL